MQAPTSNISNDVKSHEIRTQVISYFAEKFQNQADVSRMPLNGGLMDYLGVDSLASLEILIDMESLFNIEICDELLSFKLVDNVEHMVATFLELKQ